MRKIITLFIAFACIFPTWARQLSPEEASEVARSFLNQSTGLRSTGDIHLAATSADLVETSRLRNTSGQAAFYVFNQGNEAYVIVSGDDRMKPVLGYSHTGAFETENIPANMKAFLTAYSEYHARLDSQQKLPEALNLRSEKSFAQEVQPLLGDINYNQDAPYYNECPVKNGEQTVSGCVATAMAMVMRYHKYPAKGIGTHTYKESDGTVNTFDYGNTAFDWKNMLPTYVEGNYNEEQAQAVAALMYACGVSVNMEYGSASSGGSGAMTPDVADAVINYFGYNKNLGYVERDYFSTDEWMNLLKTELNESRPILYCGASLEVGHAFVFDGYDKDNLVHVNWGWGGMNNGYFEVASLEPSSPGIGGGSGAGGGFVFNQGMVIGMQPSTDNISYTSRFKVEKIVASKTSVQKGEKFDVKLTNIYNMTSTFHKGNLDVVMEDKDGKQYQLTDQTIDEAIPTRYGWKEIDFAEAAVPTNVKDGTYRLYIGSKEERETKYNPARGTIGSEIEYVVTVKGNQCELTPFSGFLSIEKDLSADVEATHTLYSGMNANFKLTFSNANQNNEYFGIAGVALMDKEGNNGIVIGQTQLLLPANTEEQTLQLSGLLAVQDQSGKITAIPEGEYLLVACVQWGSGIYSIGNPTEVQIKTGQPCEKIKSSNEKLAKSQLLPDEALTLTADITLDGEGDVFNDLIYAAVCLPGQNNILYLAQQAICVEKESLPHKLTMSFTPILPVGKYEVVLCRAEGNQLYIIGKALPFELTNNPTGLEQTIEHADGVTVCGISDHNELRILTSPNARQADIYSISGQKIHQEQLNGGTGDYTFQVQNLSKGVYILVVQTNDGKVYTTKFRKN